VDEARIPEVAAATAKSGAWVVPTLVMPLNVLPPNEVAAAFQRPTVRYATPYLRGWWRMGVEGVSTEEDWAAIRRGKELRLKIVRALHDAGVPLLIGTDTPHAFVVPGFAVHDEIQFFVNAGLTPYEAISAATVNVGKFLSKPKTIGIVAPGAQADLILLKDNPLDDVKNLARTAGVMYHGRWLSQEDLQRGLDESVAKYKQKDKTATPAEHSEQ
jgi:imidazolonepropionase-like amidohydrolase